MSANGQLARTFGGHEDRLIAFVCECGDPGCYRGVLLTIEEYERRRPGLIVHDGHRRPHARFLAR